MKRLALAELTAAMHSIDPKVILRSVPLHKWMGLPEDHPDVSVAAAMNAALTERQAKGLPSFNKETGAPLRAFIKQSGDILREYLERTRA